MMWNTRSVLLATVEARSGNQKSFPMNVNTTPPMIVSAMRMSVMNLLVDIECGRSRTED
jgi:hypothetical protein